jgi:hypothetical protein
MASSKRRLERTALPGAPAAKTEWQAQRDDAREREAEKTQRLRAARLAAQAASPASRVMPNRPKRLSAR